MNIAFYRRETLLSTKRYRLMSLKVFVLCFMCALIMTFTFSFGISLKNDMNTIINNKMSLCQNTVLLDEGTSEMLNDINEQYLLTYELTDSDFYGKSLDDFSIEYAGSRYKGINDYSYDFAITDMIIEDMCSVDFKISAISAESTLFSEGDSKEFRASLRFMGDIPKKDKEIMISDYYLSKFDVNKDDIIGNRISVFYKNNCIIKDYIVCGVIDSNIFYLHGKKNYPQIYISDKDALSAISSANKKLCIYSPNYPEAVKKRDALISQNYPLEENDAVVLYSTIYTEQDLIIKTFGCLCIVLLITAVVVLKGIIKGNIATRSKYFIMLRNMGLKRSDIRKLIFIELFVKIVFSAFFGSIAVYPLLVFIKDMIYYALLQKITIEPINVVFSSLLVTILFLIITIFESFSGSKLIYKEKW